MHCANQIFDQHPTCWRKKNLLALWRRSWLSNAQGPKRLELYSRRTNLAQAKAVYGNANIFCPAVVLHLPRPHQWREQPNIRHTCHRRNLPWRTRSSRIRHCLHSGRRRHFERPQQVQLRGKQTQELQQPHQKCCIHRQGRHICVIFWEGKRTCSAGNCQHSSCILTC